jgi:tetratricopeptide (TPR) repeat protein
MFKKLFIAAAVVLALSASAWSQVQGKLLGVVRDSQGNPLEKASVRIVSTKTAAVNYELSTNKEGRFLQVGMQPGYYQVAVRKDGYMPRTLEVHVAIASEANVEFKLESASEVAMQSVSAADKAFIRGNALYGEQKYAEAAAAFEEAVKLGETNWGYYLNLGLAYKKLDKKDEALAAFRQAAELNPASYSANKELGEALAKADAFEEAKTYYQKAVELSPADPDAHFNLGACLTNAGEQDAALEQFLKTTELKPDYADAYYQMGTIYIGKNEVAKAVQSLEKFLELAPTHAQAPLAKQLLEYLKK